MVENLEKLVINYNEAVITQYTKQTFVLNEKKNPDRLMWGIRKVSIDTSMSNQCEIPA